MALLTVSINDPGLDKKSAEVSYAIRALNEVIKELGRGNSPTALGSWTYTPSASNP